MLLNEFLQKANQVQKGKFTKASWKSQKQVNGDNYEKVSNGVVRFVAYRNIKGVQPKTTTKVNTNVTTIVKDMLTFNSNTNNYLVHMATTNHKAKSKYYCNGKEITKQEYDNIIPPSNGVKVIFNVKLENLISLG